MANWILGVICDLKLAYSPPIALFPLETENSFALSVGLVGYIFVFEDIQMNMKLEIIYKSRL